MSLISSLITTVIFFGLTAAIIDTPLISILNNAAGFVRIGFPLLAIESMLLIAGYLWLVHIRSSAASEQDTYADQAEVHLDR